MSYRHLDEFLIRLEQSADLLHVAAPVSAEQELAAITQRVAARSGKRNVALWFEQVEGSDFPVVTNLFGTSRRMAWALGVDHLDALRLRMLDLLDLNIPGGFAALLNRGTALMAAFRSMGAGVNTLSSAPFAQEVITLADGRTPLPRLPMLRHWPAESAPALTMAQIITHNNAAETRHVALARVEILHTAQAPRHLRLGVPLSALHLSELSTGATLPAAVVLGGDPAAMWCAAAPRPREIDPYLLAGWLRRKDVQGAHGVSPPLRVPADAEIVIEGVIDPAATYISGDSADLTGFYAPGEPHAIMQVTAITHRRDAVVRAWGPCSGPNGDPWAQKAIERLYVPVLHMLLDEVCDINLPDEGASRNLALASIQKRGPGAAHKVMYGLWGLGQLAAIKTVVVLDDDIDIHDTQAVILRMLATVDWRRDLVVVDGPLHRADRAALRPGFGGKLGIDATRKPDRPPLHAPQPVDAESVTARIGTHWRNWGDRVIVAAIEQATTTPREVIDRLWQVAPDQHIVIVDAHTDLDDISALTGDALACVDWRRDLIFPDGGPDPYATTTQPGVLAVDATRKHNPPMTPAPDITARVNARWKEYGL